ncbi:hypothetical protein BH23BAC3_BH23BAC3_14210 [soil metagenome]
MKKIYHLEVNGKTNTGIYVNKIISAVTSIFGASHTIKVFTSEDSFYNSQSVDPVFKKYGSISNPIIKLFYYIKGFWGVFNHLNKEQNENTLLHLHWLKFSLFDLIILTLIRYKTKTKLVFTVHNVLPHECNFIDKLVYPLIYRRIDVFTFHSESSYRRLVNELNVDVKKYDIIPHYGNEVGESNEVPKQNSLLFFGSIRDYKGLDVLIDACTKISKIKDWTLGIYGKPEMDISDLKMKVKDQGIFEHINWHTGWIEEDDIDKIFHSHEIVILPYKHIDNSGLLHLAMSYGKPIIASRLGSLEDIIEDGKNGILCEPGNPEELAKKISLLLGDEDLKRKIGDNAAQLMKTKHSIDRIGQLHCELYKRIEW